MLELNVRELLDKTYRKLCEKHKPREIVLPDETLAEIANDSDYHRTRVGYMGYRSAGLFQFDRKTWAIARGEACGSYPADPYDSNLLALEFTDEGKAPEQIQKELKEEIERSSYFKNSLIFGKADGNLALGEESKFKVKMLRRLQPEIQSFIAQTPEYDGRFISMSTLQPVNTKRALYKGEFVNFLAESIEEVLRSFQ